MNALDSNETEARLTTTNLSIVNKIPNKMARFILWTDKGQSASQKMYNENLHTFNFSASYYSRASIIRTNLDRGSSVNQLFG
jgi:hypothetical protein